MSVLRLSMIVASLARGGIGRTVVTLANGLAASGVLVDLLVADGDSPYMNMLTDGVQILPIPTTHLLFGLPTLVRYLRRVRPQALLTHIERIDALALRARALSGVRVPVFSTLHTHLGRFLGQLKPAKREAHLKLMRLAYPRNDGLISVSAPVAEDAAALLGLPSSRFDVIHNPIASASLQARAGEDPGHPWLAAGEPPVLLAVGRLETVKDFPNLLEDHARLRRDRPCRLLILGEGSQRRALQAQAERLGTAADVQLPGFVANPYAYMSRAAVLVSSSLWEGFGNVLVEAMACGTPVVATDCPGGPAGILENGRHGRLVAVGDARALADAVTDTLAAPLPAAQLQAAAARYDVARSVAHYRSRLGL